MKKITLLLFIVFTILTINAQISDSFKILFHQRLQNNQSKDSVFFQKLKILHEITTAGIIKYKSDIEKIVNEISFELNKRTNKSDSIKILSALSCYYSKTENQNDYSVMKLYLFKVKNLIKNDTKYKLEIKETYEFLTGEYIQEFKLDTALDLLNQYKSLIDETDSNSMLGLHSIYYEVYKKLELYDEAINHQKQYNKLAQEIIKDKNHTIHSFFKIANSYINKYSNLHLVTDKDSAIKYLELAKKTDYSLDTIWNSTYNYYKGRIYYYDKNFTEAYKCFYSAIYQHHIASDNYIIGIQHNSKIYLSLTKYYLGDKSGIDELSKIEFSFFNLDLQKNVQEILYQFWKKRNHTKNALKYFEQYHQINDSINVLKYRTAIFTLNQKFEIQEKDKSIQSLQIKSLKQQKSIFIISIISSLCVITLVFISYYKFTKIKQKELINNLEKANLLNQVNQFEIELNSIGEKHKKEKNEILINERESITQNIHDEISNGIAALRLYIKDLRSPSSPSSNNEKLDLIEEEAASLYINTRNFMKRLNGIYNNNISISVFLNKLKQNFTIFNQINIIDDVDYDNLKKNLSASQYTELYFIVKEAVYNSIKHSNAKQIIIHIEFDKNICRFSIQDNGRGFTEIKSKNGLGINNIKQRINKLNGTVEFISSDKGVSIQGSFEVNI